MTDEAPEVGDDLGEERLLAQRLTVAWATHPRVPAASRARALALTAYGTAGRPVRSRWAHLLVAALVGLLLGGLAVAASLPQALPGHPAYAVKQLLEAVRIELAQGPDARAAAWFDVAEARLEEAVRAEATGRGELIDQLLVEYVAAVGQARGQAAETTERTTGERIAGGLATHEQVLEGLLDTAPLPARPGLLRALAAARGDPPSPPVRGPPAGVPGPPSGVPGPPPGAPGPPPAAPLPGD